MTRDERRARRERELQRWLRLGLSCLGPLQNPREWAAKMLGMGSLSRPRCPCCNRKRRRYGPRFSEVRQVWDADEDDHG